MVLNRWDRSLVAVCVQMHANSINTNQIIRNTCQIWGKATWPGTYRISKLIQQLSQKTWQKTNPANAVRQCHTANTACEWMKPAKRRSKGIGPPGDAVTHSYQSLPLAPGNRTRWGWVCPGGCWDILWMKRWVESGRCMLCSSWWGKGGAEREGRELGRKRRRMRAVVIAGPSAIVHHSSA